MARSLTVKQEETPTTNPLLTGFLVIAALVLVASALQGVFPDRTETVEPPAVVESGE